MPLLFFRRQKKAQPIDTEDNSNDNFYFDDAQVAPFGPAELELIPLEFARCRPEIVYRNVNRNIHGKHVSMFAEPMVWEESSAPFAGGDEDDSTLLTDTSVASPAHGHITTTDSWLVYEYPSLYVKGIEEEEETEVSPMSSTETLVAVETVKPQVTAVAAKLEAIVAEVPQKVKVVQHPTLIPLAVAQARADIKYRAEGFEMKEGLQALQAKRSEKVWWN